MLSQYTADTLIVEQRILSAPSCVQSIPAAADQEDFVSMGMNGALKTVQILENARSERWWRTSTRTGRSSTTTTR